MYDNLAGSTYLGRQNYHFVKRPALPDLVMVIIESTRAHLHNI